MSPLREELVNLKKKIEREDDRLAVIEEEFWSNGGICCPFCGVIVFRDMKGAQERREKRVVEIERKLLISHSSRDLNHFRKTLEILSSRLGSIKSILSEQIRFRKSLGEIFIRNLP